MKHASLADSCKLCSIVDGNYEYGAADKPIFETENFMVIPSIGAFIDGWIMIVPKKHVYDMSTYYSSSEFLELTRKVYTHIEINYGPLIMFEHGASYSGSPTGCGVDHAHFHFVPFSESLLPALLEDGSKWIRCEAKEIASKAKNQDYLFYSEVLPLGSTIAGYLHLVETPVSQFFRTLLAVKTKKKHVSDYKVHLFIDKAERTAQKLTSAA